MNNGSTQIKNNYREGSYMLNVIESKVWDLLKKRKVSFAMIYDIDGNILWYKGRSINGRTIDDGIGFSKTYIAELIHNRSARKGKFKIIHTPSIPESLFESEVFGHKKGAFTNAAYDKKGLVEEAAGGTLLIDETTEVSVALQAKLLRFIETGKYTRLGESFERKVDVRIIAATNKDLQKAIEDKEFREDLYYRLNVFEIELPPLRERKQDLKALVLEKIKYLNGKKIGDELWNDFKAGKNFWEVVKKPFLSRDLKRSEVKELINRGLELLHGKGSIRY